MLHQRIEAERAIGPAIGDATGLSIVDGMAPALDVLANRGAPSHRFLRAAWYGAAAEPRARTLVASRIDGTPLLAIPTVGVGPPLLGVRAVPGSYWPFRSVAVAPDASIAECAAVFAHPSAEAALGTAWRLGPVYADDPAAILLRNAAARAGWTAIERSLGPTWRLDLATRPPTADRRVAGYARRLAQSGLVELRTVTGASWTEAALSALAQIERNSWVGQTTDGSGAKFLSAIQTGRWRRALGDPVLAAALSATILSVAGTPIAFSFDLAAGDTQYAIASSYDRRFAAARPGRIVTADQFAHARHAGVRLVDLGAGDPGYKREMGAVAGPTLIDLLFVRNRAAAELVGWRWGSVPPIAGDILCGPSSPAPPATSPRARLGGLVPPLLAAGALAAVALSIAE